MISSFPLPMGDNMGGCHKFEFVDATRVSHLILSQDQSQILSPVELSPGASWLAGYASWRTLKFSEKMQENQAGTFFLCEITGFYPKLTPGALALFARMKHKGFIVITTDNNGTRRLSGRPNHPLYFSFDVSTGEASGSPNGVSFSFRGYGLHESPFYSVDQ